VQGCLIVDMGHTMTCSAVVAACGGPHGPWWAPSSDDTAPNGDRHGVAFSLESVELNASGGAKGARVGTERILNSKFAPRPLPGCRSGMAPGGTPPGRVEAKLSRTTPLVRRGKVVQEDWEVV